MANDNENENRTLSNILAAIRRQGAAFRGAFRSDPTARSRTREEARERAKKLRDAVEKGFGIAFKKTGLTKLASNLGSFMKTGGKGILFGSALVAFFAFFVNTPFFDKFIDFLRDKIIPGIGKLIDWLDKNGVNIENGMKLLFKGLSSVGDFLLNTVKLMTDDNYTFEEFFNENWKGFTAALTGVLVLFGGFKAPILLALATGGVLFRMGKWIGNFFSRNGALATAANALDDVAPGGNMRGTPTLAAQNTARSSNLTNRQMARMGVFRAADGALVESGSRTGSVRGRMISAADMSTRLDRAGVRQFRPPRGTPNAAIARQFPRIAKLMRFMGPLMAIASVAQVYSLLGSEKSKQEKLKGVASIFGGLGGGLLGAKMGGLLGLFGGPFGAVIGSVAGGIGGYLAGDHLGDLLARYILGENLELGDVFPMGLGELLMKKGTALAESIAAGDMKTADTRTAQATQNLKVMPTTEGGGFQGKDAIAGDKGRLVFGELSYNARAAIQDQVSRKLRDKAALFRGEEGAQRKILMEQRLIQKALTSIAEQLAQNAQTVLVGTTPVGTSDTVVVPMGSINSQNETLKFYGGP